MVHLKLIENNEDIIRYQYMPEKLDAQPGIIEIDKHTGERNLIEKSPDDKGFCYYGHAFDGMERMLDNNNIKEYTYVAWY